jgi:hypothetical protein
MTARYRRWIPYITFVLLICTPAISLAQIQLTEHTLSGNPNVSTEAKLEDVKFLIGHWRGEGLGGIVEEIWSPPLGNTMMGMFRLVEQDAVSFYELMTMAVEDGHLTLRVKHFGADLTAWEERSESVSFRFVKADSTAMYFEGLTFRFPSGDKLEVYIAMRNKDGTHREEKLTYRRNTTQDNR